MLFRSCEITSSLSSLGTLKVEGINFKLVSSNEYWHSDLSARPDKTNIERFCQIGVDHIAGKAPLRCFAMRYSFAQPTQPRFLNSIYLQRRSISDGGCCSCGYKVPKMCFKLLLTYWKCCWYIEMAGNYHQFFLSQTCSLFVCLCYHEINCLLMQRKKCF